MKVSQKRRDIGVSKFDGLDILAESADCIVCGRKADRMRTVTKGKRSIQYPICFSHKNFLKEIE
jgi:hypothetical protein